MLEFCQKFSLPPPPIISKIEVLYAPLGGGGDNSNFLQKSVPFFSVNIEDISTPIIFDQKHRNFNINIATHLTNLRNNQYKITQSMFRCYSLNSIRNSENTSETHRSRYATDFCAHLKFIDSQKFRARVGDIWMAAPFWNGFYPNDTISNMHSIHLSIAFYAIIRNIFVQRKLIIFIIMKIKHPFAYFFCLPLN